MGYNQNSLNLGAAGSEKNLWGLRQEEEKKKKKSNGSTMDWSSSHMEASSTLVLTPHSMGN